MTDDDDDDYEVPDYRRCQFCKHSGDPDFDLFKYGVRHYAHAVCLARRYGTKAAANRITVNELRSFRRFLKAADEWDRAAIRVRDDAIERQARIRDRNARKAQLREARAPQPRTRSTAK